MRRCASGEKRCRSLTDFFAGYQCELARGHRKRGYALHETHLPDLPPTKVYQWGYRSRQAAAYPSPQERP